MVNTIKFSQMTAGGDISNNDTVPGLLSGENVLFNNPWTFLAPGTTAERPTPASAIYFRLRFNTDSQVYEYFNPIVMQWVELSGSGTGTVNPGVTNAIAFYASNGTTLSPIDSINDGVFVTNGSGVPSFETTLPAGIFIPGATITTSTAALTSGQVIATPVNPTDLVNKSYVDAQVGGTVLSITGTTNQVIASSPTGNVTLSLPQDIATGSSPTFSALTSGSIKFSTNAGLIDSNSNEILALSPVSSAVNYAVVANNITGLPVVITAAGTDTNIGISIIGKDTGQVNLSSINSTPLIISSGTAYQHTTNFAFSNTNANRTVTWPDADGTVAFTSNLPTGAELTETNDTNVTMTLGGSPTTALLNATSMTLGWAGQLAVGRGGTGVASVTTAPAATSFAGWDANKNLSANNLIPGFTTTVSSATPIVLTVASAELQYISGSTAQTVTMPVTSTLSAGASWTIVNLSSATTTVQSSGANTIVSLPAGSQATVTCILNSGTTAASWSDNFSLSAAGVASITGTANEVIASSPTGAVTLSLPQAIATTSTPTFGALTLTNPYIAGAGGLHSFQVFTTGTSATYTKPANVTSILVEVVGGGGGGGGVTGGSAGAVSGSAGGGGGGYARLFVPSAASTYTYTVGAGGTGGTAGPNGGASGGTTTFSASSLQATGGNGGVGDNSHAVTVNVTTASGAFGGTGSNGNINSSGSSSTPAAALSGTVFGSTGGSSHYGGGNSVLAVGGAYGGGGSGNLCTTTSAAGFAGAAGIIIVWEFA